MEARHTPGKWEVYYRMPSQENDNCTNNSIMVEGRNIADVWASNGHICKTKAECDANARLIAAAPELLEALKGLLSWSAHLPFAADDKIEFARKVIEKATNI